MSNTFSYTSLYRKPTQAELDSDPVWYTKAQRDYHGKCFYFRIPLAPCRGLRHLILRLDAHTFEHEALYLIYSFVQFSAYTPSLLTLRVDIMGLEEGFLGHISQQDALEDCHTQLEPMINHRRKPKGGLSQIILTGLSDNYAGLMVVREASFLLAKNGEMGIGIGKSGKRYVLDLEGPDPVVKALPEPSLTWVNREDIGFNCRQSGSWLEKAAKTMDPDRIFEAIEIRAPWPEAYDWDSDLKYGLGIRRLYGYTVLSCPR